MVVSLFFCYYHFAALNRIQMPTNAANANESNHVITPPMRARDFFPTIIPTTKP